MNNVLVQTIPSKAMPERYSPIKVLVLEQADSSFKEQNAAPRRDENYKVIWVRSGNVTVAVDLTSFTLAAGQMCCVAPSQVYSLFFTSQVEGYIISFSDRDQCFTHDHINLIRQIASIDPRHDVPRFPITEETDILMLQIAVRLKKEAEGNFKLRSELIGSLLKVLLIDLARNVNVNDYVSSKINNRRLEVTYEFFRLLDERYASHKMVLEYAEELSVTPNYLNEIIKAVTGFSASHHIQQRVALEAKRQAMYARKNMKEVAYSLGFEDVAHFSKFFKRTVGLTFTDFKRIKSNLG